MSPNHTVQQQRKIQKEVEQADKKGKSKPSGAMQAGARRYPEPPFPQVHQDKPGSEADLPLAPMYDAPFYKGSEKLMGKVALITGGFRHRTIGCGFVCSRGCGHSYHPSR